MKALPIKRATSFATDMSTQHEDSLSFGLVSSPVEEVENKAFQLHYEVKEHEERLSELQAESQRLKCLLDSRKSSLSWRCTAPLRKMHSLTRSFGSSTKNPSFGFTWLKDLQLMPRGAELAIDVSLASGTADTTGIQRVVRSITRELVTCGSGEVIALNYMDRDLRDVSALPEGGSPEKAPSLRSFRRLLLLDASWHVQDDIEPLVRACHQARIPVITCVYDLVPIDHPTTTKGNLSQIFRRWLDGSIAKSDAFVCISKTTAERLRKYIQQEYRGPRRASAIGWWHLGSDFAKTNHAPEKYLTALPCEKFCLVVGTLEPRKNADFILDCFSDWWRTNSGALGLVFAGSEGWGTEGLADSIVNHPEFGRNLWWVKDPDDRQLVDLYARSSVVSMASRDEGFGLPLIEAAHFGKPVVASDIPVFREIAGSGVRFFNLGDAISFRDALEDSLADTRLEPKQALSWGESARNLKDLILSDAYQIRLPV